MTETFLITPPTCDCSLATGVIPIFKGFNPKKSYCIEVSLYLLIQNHVKLFPAPAQRGSGHRKRVRKILEAI